MSKNINCKKSWHPSCFEVQNKIRNYKIKEEERKKRKELVIYELNEEINEENKLQRMNWMIEE